MNRPDQTLLSPDTTQGGEHGTTLALLGRGDAVLFDGIALSACRIRGRRMVFCTDTGRDIVQQTHRGGAFYETEELDRIADIFPEGGTFLDIGANIGNHALFVAAFCKPAKVVVIEPNPRAWKLLIANVMANGFEDVFDLSRLGVGLSDTDGAGFGMEVKGRRLGSLKMQPGDGTLEVRRGDTWLADVAPDVVKVDVEGMELSALRGLEGLIDAHRPALMVEVEQHNDAAFHTWLAGRKYHIEDRYAVNAQHINYIARAIGTP